MIAPQAATLPGNRLHLQHGPIDLVIGAEGDTKTAFIAARHRFLTLLDELVDELPLLRRPVADKPLGAVARRMFRAVKPHRNGIITPMAAVAGAVAEEVLAAMTEAVELRRAYVNNGGDIALHLQGSENYKLAIASLSGEQLGQVTLHADDQIRGIATSGFGGRSLSFGIAESVTVIAPSAAQADAAATMIGNAVNLPGHPAILRRKASDMQTDSDLRDHLVVANVGHLAPVDVARALNNGVAAATAMAHRGLICGAAFFLRGQHRVFGLAQNYQQEKVSLHA